MESTVSRPKAGWPFVLTLVVLGAVLSQGALAADYAPEVKKGVNAIYGKDIQRHIEVLASDAFEGREAGKKGGLLAGDYIAGFFRACGLKPGGENGTYFQQFPLKGGSAAKGTLADANTLKVSLRRVGARETVFVFGKDFVPFCFSACTWVKGEVVFAGYGISAPEYRYDDYKGLDVKGKIVIVLSHEPQEADPESAFAGTKLTAHAAPLAKAKLAQKNGAAALLIVPNPQHHRTDPLGLKELTAWPPPPDAGISVAIPVARCTRGVVGCVFAAPMFAYLSLSPRFFLVAPFAFLLLCVLAWRIRHAGTLAVLALALPATAILVWLGIQVLSE